jgi:hypothetical protein
MVACEHDGQKAPSAPYESAVVEQVIDVHGNRVRRSRAIMDLEQLVSFFPGLGQGNRSEVAAPWKIAVTIRFMRPDGTEHIVTSSYDYWNEGAGDWPVDHSYSSYIESLFEEDHRQ